MPIKDPLFEENAKKAFLKIKGDILFLKNELKEQREFIIKQNSIINILLAKIEEKRAILDEKNLEKPISKPSSIGNQGVYANIHSFIHSDMHSDIHLNKQPKQAPEPLKEPFKGINNQINQLFGNLTKQELFVFLTIYQLEEDIGNVSYIDIAKKLELSEGCIRTYISNLMKKGVPILKKRHNNKIVYLSVSDEFRELKLKDKLSDLYYKSADPQQTRLSHDF